MEEERKDIVYIGTEHIHPHPENPRKALGDLEELSESMKKNGVMQNLTVVPIDDRPGEYYALIGNRRHGAAVKAGIMELPCRIAEGLSRREQLSIMLEENMQRNDLTIYEQAQGFQLMLDLGETEESIAEKTGFSRTTVRHRLNIAKLNQDELKKKDEDESFQLSLRDLYELEKVKDVKIRNKILAESDNSRDLVTRAQNAVAEQKREANAKIIKAELKKLGLSEAPKNYESEVYTGKWKTVEEYDLDKDVPKKIVLPEDVPVDKLYMVSWWRRIRIVMRAKKEKRELSQWEIEQKEKDKKKKQIRMVLKESSARRKAIIENIISGKIEPVKDERKEVDMVWAALLNLGSSVYSTTLRGFFLEKDPYSHTEEERQEAQRKVDELSTLHQMLVALHLSMDGEREIYDYQLHFRTEKGEALQKGYEALMPYGWYFEKEEEKQVIDGTHELYEKDNKEGEK